MCIYIPANVPLSCTILYDHCSYKSASGRRLNEVLVGTCTYRTFLVGVVRFWQTKCLADKSQPCLAGQNRAGLKHLEQKHAASRGVMVERCR